MSIAAQIVIALVALLHVWFLVLEMFLWDKPAGRKAFGTTAEFAAQSKVLAANQGLYNGFLSAGLLWSLWLGTDGLAVARLCEENEVAVLRARLPVAIPDVDRLEALRAS